MPTTNENNISSESFLNKTIHLLEVMQKELKEKEYKCKDGRMLIRIGHRISSIHKVKYYIKQRIKNQDIPAINKGNSNNSLYNLKHDL
jgi:formylmethanofuran dehydrogenase subunit A